MRKVGWLVLAWFALQASGEALAYLARGPEGFDGLFRAKYTLHLPTVVLHGLSGVVALVAGPPLFLVRRGAWHKRLGKVYLASVGMAGLTGLPMALWAFGGPWSQASFLLFDLLWLATAGLAWHSVRARRFAAHRRWMIRNYALTYGAVVVRLLLNELQLSGYAFEAIYPACGWVAWGASLAVAELTLIRGGRPWS